jgi:hypothetical protein
MAPKNQDTFTPEMIRVLKIFGIGSFLFVLLLSFFNERKANNTGEVVSEMWMSDSQRIFFKNLRGAYYDQEVRNDAKMTVYRHSKRLKDASYPFVNFAILINRVKNEAYIFAEPSFESLPFTIRWSNKFENSNGEVEFEGGDKFTHFQLASRLFPLLTEEVEFEIKVDNQWKPVFQEDRQRLAVRTTLEDYFQLVNSLNIVEER